MAPRTRTLGSWMGGVLQLCLRLLANEHALISSLGRTWRGLHCYCWLVLCSTVVFEAPLFPACPADSAEAQQASELQGSAWCALLLRSIGLAKLQTGRGSFSAALWNKALTFWLVDRQALLRLIDLCSLPTATHYTLFHIRALAALCTTHQPPFQLTRYSDGRPF